MIRIKILALAESDMQSAANWYDAAAPGLADAFLMHVHVALDRVAIHPELYQLAFDDVREIPLDRFPYNILYRVLPGEIHVMGVLHSRRDPIVARIRAGIA